MFDETNTEDWQQVGNGVYLLQECAPPYRRGKVQCENRYSITVQSKDRNHADEVEIAKKIAAALNGNGDR